ncbi:HPr family phosphocarrier protein [Solemya velesiana gill symbiont]|uniref:Phosphocarrier protein HPr n=1 Tax=Solemya velesiana gill symbiont TaxID=1918948 RepID=A0A1T2KVL6_9GAMM|nr:HPr family phosphocarrier protein [Solemya velesiana gill symbiont]OOZ36780.1 phosphocarrier protein HPr [Solemya velesiana gill symbiont]
MITKEIEIINKLGLHARAAAKLVTTAGQFSSDILLSNSSQEANGKSIMGVVMLAASQGTTLTLSANGADEQEAFETITALINDKFGEGE